MWWKIIIELLLVVFTILLAINLWALIKSPSHWRHAISDKKIIIESLNIIGSDKFIEEAKNIKNAFGDSKIFIDKWDNSRINSLSITKNLLKIPYVIVLVISTYMGISYLIINIIVSLLIYLLPINSYAINNNMVHIHTVMLNIYKWNTEDKSGCENYCTFVHPEYLQIYKIIDGIKGT